MEPKTRLRVRVCLVVAFATCVAGNAPADAPAEWTRELEPFRQLVEPPRVSSPSSDDPALDALSRVVDEIAVQLGRPIDSAGAIRASGIGDGIAAHLAATLAALRDCQTATAAALDGVPAEAILAAARGEDTLEAERFLPVRDCAVPVWRALGGLELHLKSSAVSGERLDLWPVLRLETGATDDVYRHDYVLLVDAAGNDTYWNNAGGNVMDLLRGPAAPAPEIGPARGCQTALNGFQAGDCQIGQAVLLDLAGDDTYGVFETPDADALCTEDRVIRRTSTIGSGLVGVGILRDSDGNDRYNAKSSAIGAGHVFGVGILSDAAGNDSYLAVRNSQGFALLGGFGLLHDEEGNDTYDWFMPSAIDPGAPNESPGAGGVVDDVGLCDRVPRFVQGAGNLGQGIGMLVDDRGDDTYRGATSPTYGSSIGGGVPTGSQGFGAQGGTGFFFDRDGTDSYAGVADRMDGALVPPGEESTGTGLFSDQGADPSGPAVVVLPVASQFVPAVVTIPVGGTVTWRNDTPGGVMYHTVTTADDLSAAQAGIANDPSNDDGDPDTFDVPLPQGSTFSHTFTRAGTFTYFCRPHASLGMVGTVVVGEPEPGF